MTQVMQTINSVVQSLQAEKREKRRLYFAQVANQHFLLGRGTHQIQEVIANHATRTFEAWAERFEMPEGDSSVALSVLGSLAAVTTSNVHVLNNIPIRNASKEMITRFFGAEKFEMLSCEDNMFPDDIGDSEFAEYHDISSLNATLQPPFCSFQASTNQSSAQHYQPSGHSSNRTHSVSSRNRLSHPSGSNESDPTHTNQFIYQGYEGYNCPTRSNHFT
jgi:hypothetical protein